MVSSIWIRSVRNILKNRFYIFWWILPRASYYDENDQFLQAEPIHYTCKPLWNSNASIRRINPVFWVQSRSRLRFISATSFCERTFHELRFEPPLWNSPLSYFVRRGAPACIHPFSLEILHTSIKRRRNAAPRVPATRRTFQLGNLQLQVDPALAAENESRKSSFTSFCCIRINNRQKHTYTQQLSNICQLFYVLFNRYKHNRES